MTCLEYLWAVVDSWLTSMQLFWKEKWLCPRSQLYLRLFVRPTGLTVFYIPPPPKKKPDTDMMVRVFANGPWDLGSIPGQVISKTQKMVLASLLNTQHYKVGIKSKMEQSRESVVDIKKGAFGSPSTTVANFTFHTKINIYTFLLNMTV